MSHETASPTASPMSFEAMIAAQKQERAAAKSADHAAWVARMESEASRAVPIRVRLVSLLNEARRNEVARAEARYMADGPFYDAVRDAHVKHINLGYKNLLKDVATRCDQIAKGKPSAEQIYSIGTEAIGCFSSMLPWSDGIADRDPATPPATLPASPMADSVLNLINPRGPSTRVVGGILGVPTIRIQHRDPAALIRAPTVSIPRWIVPTRLNANTQKLAATVASRRKVLQRLATCRTASTTTGQPSGRISVAECSARAVGPVAA